MIGIVGRGALRLLDVLRPALVIVDRVDRQPDDLRVALVELGLDLGEVAKLGGAHRREVLRMREQDRPLVADPVVEVDRPFRGLRREIGCFVADAKCHGSSPEDVSIGGPIIRLPRCAKQLAGAMHMALPYAQRSRHRAACGAHRPRRPGLEIATPDSEGAGAADRRQQASLRSTAPRRRHSGCCYRSSTHPIARFCAGAGFDYGLVPRDQTPRARASGRDGHGLDADHDRVHRRDRRPASASSRRSRRSPPARCAARSIFAKA